MSIHRNEPHEPVDIEDEAHFVRRRRRPGPWATHAPVGNDPMWMTGNFSGRQLIPVSQLDDDHLLNIERMLVGRGRVDPSDREELFTKWYDVIRNEIDRRKLEIHPEDHQVAPKRAPQEHRGEGAPYWANARDGEGLPYEIREEELF